MEAQTFAVQLTEVEDLLSPSLRVLRPLCWDAGALFPLGELVFVTAERYIILVSPLPVTSQQPVFLIFEKHIVFPVVHVIRYNMYSGKGSM